MLEPPDAKSASCLLHHAAPWRHHRRDCGASSIFNSSAAAALKPQRAARCLVPQSLSWLQGSGAPPPQLRRQQRLVVGGRRRRQLPAQPPVVDQAPGAQPGDRPPAAGRQERELLHS